MAGVWALLLLAVLVMTTACTSATADPAPARPAPADVPVSTAAGVALPPVAGRFSYQIGGAYAPPAGVTIVDRDRADAPAAGRYSICYVNAYQAQPEQLAWWKAHHPDVLLHRDGRLVIDKDWNEVLFDTSTAARRTELAGVIGGWMAGCHTAGYRAVEADNLDSYTRSEGLLTRSDALAFALLLVTRAHADHLALAQKNAAELSSAARRVGFDFAVAEECQVYDECDTYRAAYGAHLIEIEYTDESASFFTRACARRGTQVSLTRRDRDVTPAGDPAHVEQWCS